MNVLPADYGELPVLETHRSLNPGQDSEEIIILHQVDTAEIVLSWDWLSLGNKVND